MHTNCTDDEHNRLGLHEEHMKKVIDRKFLLAYLGLKEIREDV